MSNVYQIGLDVRLDAASSLNDIACGLLSCLQNLISSSDPVTMNETLSMISGLCDRADNVAMMLGAVSAAPTDDQMVTVSVRLPESLLASIDSQASSHGLTRSGVIRRRLMVGTAHVDG